MTQDTEDVVARLPNKDLFCRGIIPEPLSEEERQWLAKQLHEWPKRVNEARTCAISALSDMAVTEFCRLMADRQSLSDRIDVLTQALETAARALEFGEYKTDAKAARAALHQEGIAP